MGFTKPKPSGTSSNSEKIAITKAGQPYVTRAISYYTDAAFLEHNLIDLVKAATLRDDVNGVEKKRFFEYTTQGKLSNFYRKAHAHSNLVKSFEYDEHGRTIKESTHGGQKGTLTTDYSYIKNGNTLTITKTTKFNYDIADRLIKEEKTITLPDASQHTIVSEYAVNTHGLPKTSTIKKNGTKVYGITYDYDTNNRIVSIKYANTEIIRYAYNDNTTIDTMTYGNGLTLSYTYDRGVLPSSYKAKTTSGNTLFSQTYNYDSMGIINKTTHSNLFSNGLLERTYGHNVREEITSVTLNDATDFYTFAYDKSGNATTFKNRHETQAGNFIIDANSDRLLRRKFSNQGEWKFNYSNDGSITEKTRKQGFTTSINATTILPYRGF